MADVNHNLPALDPPASIAHTRRFAAALDRRVTWADQLATRRPLGSVGASAELVHRFTGMGASAIGPWAARLAARYGAGERAGAPAGADLPLAMALRRSVLAPTSRAWAPQLAPDRFDARHDDTAPEVAGRVAGELSAQGWPGQPVPGRLPIARAGAPAPARAASPWSPAGVRHADRVHPLAIAGLMERTTVAPAPDRARVAAAPAPAIAQAAAVSRAIPAQSVAPAEPSATAQPVVAQPWNAAEHAATEADPGMPIPASSASAATAPAAAARDDQHPAHAPALVSAATAPAAAARDDQHPAHVPTLVDAQPAPLPVSASVPAAGEPQLALPLVTQRRTALLRQPGPGPLARMGYAVPGEPARPPAVLPTNSSPVPARAAIPGQAPLPPQSAVPVAPIPISRCATPGPTASALAAAHDAPSLRALPAAAQALPSVAPALPGAFNTTLARRYDSPPGVQAAPVLVQRSWSPGHAAAGQAEPLAIYAGAAAWAGRAAVDPQPGVRQIARMLAPAAPIRSAIIAATPAPPIDPAATPAPLNTLEPWIETAGPSPARAAAPAAPADWGALPLVWRALAHANAAPATAEAGPGNLPSQIMRRQSAFTSTTLVADVGLASQAAQRTREQAGVPGVDSVLGSSQPGLAGPIAAAAKDLGLATPDQSERSGDTGGDTWTIQRMPLLDGPSSGDEPGARLTLRHDDERLALTLHTAARAAAPAGAPQSVPLPRDASGFAMAAALQRAPAAAPLDASMAAPPAPNSAAPAPAAGSGPPIDELARKVYDYLRRELRIEQERAGGRPW